MVAIEFKIIELTDETETNQINNEIKRIVTDCFFVNLAPLSTTILLIVSVFILSSLKLHLLQKVFESSTLLPQLLQFIF